MAQEEKTIVELVQEREFELHGRMESGPAPSVLGTPEQKRIYPLAHEYGFQMSFPMSKEDAVIELARQNKLNREAMANMVVRTMKHLQHDCYLLYEETIVTRFDVNLRSIFYVGEIVMFSWRTGE